MPVRRSDPAWQAAAEAGHKRYEGKPCTDCGGTERFTSSRMCAVCLPRKTKLWRAKNPQHIRRYQRDYAVRNSEALKAIWASHRERNREQRRALCSEWKKANPHRNAAAQMKRKAAKLQRTPSWLTQAHWAEIEGAYHFARTMQTITGKAYHVDHIVPLQGKTVSGLHVPWNLQAIPAEENQRKHNRHIV